MSSMKLSASALALALVAAPALAQTRDNVQVAGSSTVLPYATIVAEAFGENFDFPTSVSACWRVRVPRSSPSIKAAWRV